MSLKYLIYSEYQKRLEQVKRENKEKMMMMKEREEIQAVNLKRGRQYPGETQ